MRRTVGSRPECGAAAAHRQGGQVSAGGRLPRVARGLRGRGSAALEAVRPTGLAPRSGVRPRLRSQGRGGCRLRGPVGLCLRLVVRVCSFPQSLGPRRAAGAGRGLGAAWAPPSGAAGARCARGALGLRAAGCSLGFLPPAAGAHGVGPRRLSQRLFQLATVSPAPAPCPLLPVCEGRRRKWVMFLPTRPGPRSTRDGRAEREKHSVFLEFAIPVFNSSFSRLQPGEATLPPLPGCHSQRRS